MLRVYRIDPKFKTRWWGDGSLRVKSFNEFIIIRLDEPLFDWGWRDR